MNLIEKLKGVMPSRKPAEETPESSTPPSDSSIGPAPRLEAEAPMSAPGDAGAPEPVQASGVGPEATAEEAPAAPGPRRSGTGGSHAIFESYTTEIYGQPDHTLSYQHGHVDGTFEGDPEAFRAYIGAREDLLLCEARIGETQRQLKDVLAERENVRELHHRTAWVPVRIGHLDERVETAMAEREAAREELQVATKLEEDTRERASWANVWIYAAATIAFLLGDMMVSKEVVSQVLKLPERMFLGLSEQWWFAIGIALLAMVVKLGYERAVEKPYQRGEHRAFRRVVVWVSIPLTLATLALLGWTRAYYTDQMAHTGTLSEDQVMAQVMAQMSGAPAASGAEQDSTTPLPITIAFIATAVLFAITGGICGGVAVQAWHVEVDERAPARARLKAARERVVVAEQAWGAALDVRRVAQEEHARNEEALRLLRAPSVLDGEVKRLEEVLDALREAQTSHRSATLTHSYDSGLVLSQQNRIYLDKTPGATMHLLTQLAADLLGALDGGTIARGAGQLLLDSVREATKRYLSGAITPEAFLSLLADARTRLEEMRAQGPPPPRDDEWPGFESSGDGSAVSFPPQRRPHMWMRDEVMRMSRAR